MKEEFEILEQIGNAKNEIEKGVILHDNIDNDDLRTILQYTYNPYLLYGVGNKLFKNVNGETSFRCMFDLFDYVLANAGKDKTQMIINKYISNQPIEDREWIKRILQKDLKNGVSIEMINNVWDNFIPSVNINTENKIKGDK
jgi:hypothetical protein